MGEAMPLEHRGQGEHPVASVSHFQALDFCRRYGSLLGAPCRLPTEAEWEYACRAGTATSFCSGEGRKALELVGWCSYDGTWDGAGGTRPVMLGRPNSWGIFDMHGNVWEWCSDGMAPYPAEPVSDPHAEAAETEQRVIRGGSWRGGPWFCRSAERWALPPEVEGNNNGFRVAMDLSP
jgi:formylglycine-generating enzyme required for sulfatase activity